MQAEQPIAGPGKLPVAKIIAAVVLLVALIVVFKIPPVAAWISTRLTEFQHYVRGLGTAGYVVYALVYAVCCVAFLPASVLTLGAGAIFGLIPGTIVVVFGATLGAAVSFLLARTVMRRKVEALTERNRKFLALDRAISTEGAKIALLIRLSPIFPFTYINYAFGLTGIRFLPFFLATFFGIIPGSFAFVYLGYAAANAAAGSGDATRKGVQIAGAVAAVIVTIVVARIASRAIKRAGVDEGAAPATPRP